MLNRQQSDQTPQGSLVQMTAEWLRLSAWTDQSGTPQPSLDIDANHLVLLDRAETATTVRASLRSKSRSSPLNWEVA